MEQYYFYIHADRCIECHSCQVACNQEHRTISSTTNRRNISEQRNLNGRPIYLSMSCNHCKNPICVTICPNNNYKKLKNGIVIHHDLFCEGCKLCVEACPFGAPKYNPESEKVDKCDFCHERLKDGLNPTCVDSCPTSALSYSKLVRGSEFVEMEEEDDVPISKLTGPSIKIKDGLKPRRYFRGRE